MVYLSSYNMIPVSDEPQSRVTAFINWLIIVSCVVVFLWQVSGGASHFRSTIQMYGFIPSRLFEGEFYYTLITSMFLHSGLIHLGGNMLFLYIFGDNIEGKLGHIEYPLFYLACGVFSSAIWGLFNSGTSRPAVGASGAISGILGAYFFLYPGARITSLIPISFFLWPIKIPAGLMIGFWFIYQLTLAFIAPKAGVAFWIHVVGFILGLILSFVISSLQNADE